MTGVFLPGMELPNCCIECPFVFHHRYCPGTSELNADEINRYISKGRVPGCPLVCVSFNGTIKFNCEV